jgi:SAM-dependent methyltransferase
MADDWAGSETAPLIDVAPRAAEAPAAVDRSGPTLRISARTIGRVGRWRVPEHSVVLVFLRQAFSEWRVRLLKHAYFRLRENDAALKAYCAMTTADFEGINARQRWANWRIIPRNLNGRLPSRAVKAIDLCCGVGHSTDVLAFYLSPGSEILGLEYNPEFVRAARRRTFKDEDGEAARVRFRAQSVLETFCDTDGTPVADGSVDLVNSCGAVGCHFAPPRTAVLLREIARVLRVGGLATIDAGPDGTSACELTTLAESAGFRVLGRTRSCLFDRFLHVCLQKI